MGNSNSQEASQASDSEAKSQAEETDKDGIFDMTGVQDTRGHYDLNDDTPSRFEIVNDAVARQKAQLTQPQARPGKPPEQHKEPASEEDHVTKRTPKSAPKKNSAEDKRTEATSRKRKHAEDPSSDLPGEPEKAQKKIKGRKSAPTGLSSLNTEDTGQASSSRSSKSLYFSQTRVRIAGVHIRCCCVHEVLSR